MPVGGVLHDDVAGHVRLPGRQAYPALVSTGRRLWASAALAVTAVLLAAVAQAGLSHIVGVRYAALPDVPGLQRVVIRFEGAREMDAYRLVGTVAALVPGNEGGLARALAFPWSQEIHSDKFNIDSTGAAGSLRIQRCQMGREHSFLCQGGSISVGADTWAMGELRFEQEDRLPGPIP